jgi:SAM-dependent methyltransferase
LAQSCRSRFEHVDEAAVNKNLYNPLVAEQPQIGRTSLSVQPFDTWHFEKLEACLICRNPCFNVVYQKKVRNVPLCFVKCTQCGLVFQNPRFTREALASYFSSSFFIKDADSPNTSLEDLLGYFDYEAWDASYKKTAILRLKQIRRFAPPPGHLLEIGTATGSFLDEARRTGYDVRGVDLSATFAETARRRYSLDIDVDFIEDIDLPREHYDVVCNFGGVGCWRDPMRALRNIRSSMKSSGVFVLNHPNCDGILALLYGDRYPEFNHASLTIFSNQTMRRCLTEAGFRVVASQNERQFASFGRIVTYLKSSTGLRLVKALKLEHRMIPVIAFGTTFSICKLMD